MHDQTPYRSQELPKAVSNQWTIRKTSVPSVSSVRDPSKRRLSVKSESFKERTCADTPYADMLCPGLQGTAEDDDDEEDCSIGRITLERRYIAVSNRQKPSAPNGRAQKPSVSSVSPCDVFLFLHLNSSFAPKNETAHRVLRARLLQLASHSKHRER
jgi:hypothetical protein